MESPIVEEYLEAIYKLQASGKQPGPTDLGKALAVSPPSAMEMMNRLEEKGLAARGKQKGIILTRRGEREALRLIRKHRISERFLVDILGMDWKDAHDEACKFEHVLSQDVESRMEAMLKNPGTCPHGQPIPDKDGNTVEERQRPLSSLARGESGIVAKVAEEKREFLEYLTGMGMMPGRTVCVEQIAPFDGPLLIRIDGQSHALDRDIAQKIWIKG